MRADTKFRIIHRYAHKYPITEMCRFFNVSRSGYYDSAKGIGLPDKDEYLAVLIRMPEQQADMHIHTVVGGFKFGSSEKRKFTVITKPCGALCENMVCLLPFGAEDFLECLMICVHIPTCSIETLLRCGPMKSGQPISVISKQSKAHFIYLSVIRDLYDNSIVAYKTSIQQSTRLVLDTVHAAMKKERVTGELQLHSDQGFQYASHSYFTLTQQYGIKPSMSRRGNPYDNAMAENFFGILKVECIRPAKPSTFLEAQKLIADYIHFYNHERIQIKTKLTPLEKRRLLV